MINFIWNKLKNSNWILLVVVILLFCFGLMTIYSIGLGKEPQNFSFFYKQLYVGAIGIGIVLFFLFFNHRNLKNYTFLFYIINLILLVIVLFLGSTIRGTRGWFSLGFFNLQPAELMKITLVLVLAQYLSKFAWQLNKLRHIFVSGLLALVPIILLILQPDFGSAIIIFFIWLGMIILCGISKKNIFIIGIISVLIFTCCWFAVLKDYQKQRIITFINPASDQLGRGYNVKQALITIGSGQLFGKGLGYGSQSHLKFLPENQTDFIFAVIAEELGFFGVFLLMTFWFIFFFQIIKIIKKLRDNYDIFVALGLVLFFLTQFTVNIGGNLAILPLTGVVLPFLSYGGTALLTSFLSIGLIESIKINRT